MDDLRKPILPGKGASDYERYLRTDELLSLQKTSEEFLHPDEMTFQVVHQASELSGGEQQRVALARALINKPAIVLADEPTGNLDSKNSEIVLAMLRHSNQDLGQTVLMITHNPEAASYGDRIIHMRDGEIVAPEKDPQWTGHSS